LFDPELIQRNLLPNPGKGPGFAISRTCEWRLPVVTERYLHLWNNTRREKPVLVCTGKLCCTKITANDAARTCQNESKGGVVVPIHQRIELKLCNAD